MIRTIFLKELKDTLRDRRTLITMLVIPTLVFPIILNIFMGVSESFRKDAAEKKMIMAYSGPIDHPLYKELITNSKELNMEWVMYGDTSLMKQDIAADSIQFGFFVSENTVANLKNEVEQPVSVYYDATELGLKERVESLLNQIDEHYVATRLNERNIPSSVIKPLNVAYINTASQKEMIGKLAGGILPYIFIAFGFIGCMYPAIDLFTGEKERGTIETLLTTPVKRWQILFGKMGVVVLSGLLASTCAFLGLFLSIEVLHLVEDQTLLTVIHSVLTPRFVLLLFSLLIPLTIFFAGIMIPIAVYAKSFKEAQSIITPLNILMVLPAMIGFFPGIEFDATTALIPVVNIVLATKEIIADTLDVSYLALSYLVMISLAIVSVIVSYKQFEKESHIVLS